jgi:hypothetical protein
MFIEVQAYMAVYDSFYQAPFNPLSRWFIDEAFSRQSPATGNVQTPRGSAAAAQKG